MKLLKSCTALAMSLSSLAGVAIKGNLSFHYGSEPLYNFPSEKIVEFELSNEYVYALKDAAGLDNMQPMSAASNSIELGEKLMKLSEENGYARTNKGYILLELISSDITDVYYPENLTKYAIDGAKLCDAEGNEINTLELNAEITLTARNSEGWHKYGEYYIAESEFMDSPYVEPTPTINTPTTYFSSGAGLTKSSGVNNYGGRRETYYSSNVLYHYRTSEWSLDNEGFYRTSEGYYVVAASDMTQGTTFNCSKGTCMVLDSGCAAGTTDFYVAW